jgi:hypothetical protein
MGWSVISLRWLVYAFVLSLAWALSGSRLSRQGEQRS